MLHGWYKCQRKHRWFLPSVTTSNYYKGCILGSVHHKHLCEYQNMDNWTVHICTPGLTVHLPVSQILSPVVSLLHPGLPSRTIARTVSSELLIFICPIAIAYRMGQIIKSFCVCACACVCVCARLWTLSRSHFFIDFHQIGHRRVNPQK